MKDVTIARTDTTAAVFPTTSVETPPATTTTSTQTDDSTPPIVDGHAKAKVYSENDPVGVDLAQRWSLGLDVGRRQLYGANVTTTNARISGVVSRTLSGDQNAGHTAMVYQVGVEFGGNQESKVATFGTAAHVAVRGALAFTEGGSQVYAQAGPTANLMMVSDERTEGNPYASAGVGGRAEAGVALGYGPDVERRIQIAVYADASTNGAEVGVSIKALSF